MKNSNIFLKIGKLSIRIIGESEIIKYLNKYYYNFICNFNTDNVFTIEVHLCNLQNKGNTQRIISDNGNILRYYNPDRNNYIDILLKHNENYCLVKLLNDFTWKDNWADWEFNFRLCTYLYFLEHQHILIHAAGLLHQGSVYLLTGESGAGKTTAALNCIQNPSDNVVILNDDTIVIYPEGNNFIACSSPYQSTSGLQPQLGYGILSGIYRVYKSSDLYLEPMNTAFAIQQIWTHTFSIGSLFSTRQKLQNDCYKLARTIALKTKNYNLYTPLHPTQLFSFIVSQDEIRKG